MEKLIFLPYSVCKIGFERHWSFIKNHSSCWRLTQSKKYDELSRWWEFENHLGMGLEMSIFSSHKIAPSIM